MIRIAKWCFIRIRMLHLFPLLMHLRVSCSQSKKLLGNHRAFTWAKVILLCKWLDWVAKKFERVVVTIIALKEARQVNVKVMVQ